VAEWAREPDERGRTCTANHRQPRS
jgi:hypothetical protein